MTSLVNRKEFEYEIFYYPINSVIRELLKRGLNGNQCRKGFRDDSAYTEHVVHTLK